MARRTAVELRLGDRAGISGSSFFGVTGKRDRSAAKKPDSTSYADGDRRDLDGHRLARVDAPPVEIAGKTMNVVEHGARPAAPAGGSPAAAADPRASAARGRNCRC